MKDNDYLMIVFGAVFAGLILLVNSSINDDIRIRDCKIKLAVLTQASTADVLMLCK